MIFGSGYGKMDGPRNKPRLCCRNCKNWAVRSDLESFRSKSLWTLKFDK